MPRAGVPDVLAWTHRLETDPTWTTALRATMKTASCAASELVLLIGDPMELPKSAEQSRHVQGYFLRVGWVADVARSLPRGYCGSMAESVRRKHPEFSHAIILAPPFYAESFRFRMPEVPESTGQDNGST